MLIFDIETGPLPDDILAERITPYQEPPKPAVFDPESVKLGQMKDVEKIRAKIESCRQKHAEEVAAHEATVKKDRAEWFTKAKDKAALSPLTGHVLAIGYRSTDSNKAVFDYVDKGHSEAEVLEMFWKQYIRVRKANRIMVGHNIYGFDVPFIARRSWLLAVDVPETVFERGKYIDSRVFVDTMTRWACGSRDWVKLDTLASAMCVGGKPDGVDGGMFAKMFAEDRPAALAYLKNDLDMTTKVAERMGLI